MPCDGKQAANERRPRANAQGRLDLRSARSEGNNSPGKPRLSSCSSCSEYGGDFCLATFEIAPLPNSEYRHRDRVELVRSGESGGRRHLEDAIRALKAYPALVVPGQGVDPVSPAGRLACIRRSTANFPPRVGCTPRALNLKPDMC